MTSSWCQELINIWRENPQAFHVTCGSQNLKCGSSRRHSLRVQPLTFFGNSQEVCPHFHSQCLVWTLKTYVKYLSTQLLPQTWWEYHIESMKAVQFKVPKCHAASAKNGNLTKISNNETKTEQQLTILVINSKPIWYDMLSQLIQPVNITKSYNPHRFSCRPSERGFTVFWTLYGLWVYKTFAQSWINCRSIRYKIRRAHWSKKKLFWYVGADDQTEDVQEYVRINYSLKVTDSTEKSNVMDETVIFKLSRAKSSIEIDVFERWTC